MGFDASREKLVGTGGGAKRGKNALLLTVTMGTLVPKDPHTGRGLLLQRLRRTSEGEPQRDPARGMTGRSVRNRNSLRRWNVMPICYADA